MNGPDCVDAHAAIRDLRAIRSNDPCASIAMATIKATIHTLETRWLPAGPTPHGELPDGD